MDEKGQGGLAKNQRTYVVANSQADTMRLLLLTLMVIYTVGNVRGMSTCKTLDLEMVKKKRIEAIRSQILSKLRLPMEPVPEQDGDEEAIPTPLLSLYNSTKEMLKEQQAQVQTHISTEQEEEEYFAKVLHSFNMTSEYSSTQNRNTSVMYCVHVDAQGQGERECLITYSNNSTNNIK